MLKNILDACGGAIGFWTIGYAFAFGAESGTSPTEPLDQAGYIRMMKRDLLFVATAATIVAEAFDEKDLEAYEDISMILVAFVYPVVVHSINGGFLSPADLRIRMKNLIEAAKLNMGRLY